MSMVVRKDVDKNVALAAVICPGRIVLDPGRHQLLMIWQSGVQEGGLELHTQQVTSPAGLQRYVTNNGGYWPASTPSSIT